MFERWLSLFFLYLWRHENVFVFAINGTYAGFHPNFGHERGRPENSGKRSLHGSCVPAQVQIANAHPKRAESMRCLRPQTSLLQTYDMRARRYGSSAWHVESFFNQKQALQGAVIPIHLSGHVERGRNSESCCPPFSGRRLIARVSKVGQALCPPYCVGDRCAMLGTRRNG
jgi:hypothetical protein